jgi:hypothetical protein
MLGIIYACSMKEMMKIKNKKRIVVKNSEKKQKTRKWHEIFRRRENKINLENKNLEDFF